MSNNLIKIGGLWKSKTKENVEFISGTWGPNLKILIFKNKHKRPDSKDPDYNIFLAPVEPKEKPAQQEESEDF